MERGIWGVDGGGLSGDRVDGWGGRGRKREGKGVDIMHA